MVAAVGKSGLFDDLLQVVHHTARLALRGGRVRLLQLAHTGAGLAENFVAHHLHGLGEVEREIGGIAADGEQAVAALHFINIQAECFVAEYEGYLKTLLRGLQ